MVREIQTKTRPRKLRLTFLAEQNSLFILCRRHHVYLRVGNDWSRGSGGHLRVLCICDFFIRVNSASPCTETILNWLMSIAYGSIGLIPKIT